MATQTVHDPVCHMDIERDSAESMSEHDGTMYYFCSPGCKSSFDAEPEGVLRAEAATGHTGPKAAAERPWWRFWG